MSELITVPNFTFEQGDIFEQDIDSERPISVQYYANGITLEQGGNEIIISPVYLDKLFREIKKHKPAADELLKKYK